MTEEEKEARADCEQVYRRKRCKECRFLVYTVEAESEEAKRRISEINKEVREWKDE